MPSVKTSPLIREGDGLQVISICFHLCCCGVNAINALGGGEEEDEEEPKPSPNHLSQAKLSPLAFKASSYLFVTSLAGKLWRGRGNKLGSAGVLCVEHVKSVSGFFLSRAV